MVWVSVPCFGGGEDVYDLSEVRRGCLLRRDFIVVEEVCDCVLEWSRVERRQWRHFVMRDSRAILPQVRDSRKKEGGALPPSTVQQQNKIMRATTHQQYLDDSTHQDLDDLSDAFFQNFNWKPIIEHLRGAGCVEEKAALKFIARMAIFCLGDVPTSFKEAGGIQSLVRLLSDDGANSRKSALYSLSWISRHEANIPLIYQAGAVAPTIKLPSVRATCTFAANTLQNLAREDEDCASMVNAGAFTALLNVLQMGSEKAKVAAAGAIGNLARNVMLYLEAPFERARGMPSFIDMIRDGPNEAKEAACHAFSSLVPCSQIELSTNPIARALKTQFLEMGGISLFVNLLRLDLSRAHESILPKLAHLASDGAVAEQICEAGGIEALVGVLRANKFVGTLCRMHANELLKKLSQRSQANRERARLAGAEIIQQPAHGGLPPEIIASLSPEMKKIIASLPPETKNRFDGNWIYI